MLENRNLSDDLESEIIAPVSINMLKRIMLSIKLRLKIPPLDCFKFLV